VGTPADKKRFGGWGHQPIKKNDNNSYLLNFAEDEK
jgi:hypothetical protein